MPDLALLANWIRRAALLDTTVFEQADPDEGATTNTLLVVLLAALAAWAGAFLTPLVAGARGLPTRDGYAAAAQYLAMWAAWVAISHLAATRLTTSQPTWVATIRLTSMAQAPALILILQFLPGLGLIVRLAALLWPAVVVFAALRSRPGGSEQAAIAVTAAGVLAALVVGLTLGALDVGPAWSIR